MLARGAAISLSPRLPLFTRHRAHRRPDYPAAIGLDPSKLGTALVVAVIAAGVHVLVTPAFAGKAFVALTGQTTSFAEGDDGSIQAGVKPPTPRFTDKGDGTVKDNPTDLIWLKDTTCLRGQWLDALQLVSALASGGCGLSDGSVPGDWRLPNVRELESLLDFGFRDPPLSNAAGTGQWTQGDPFSGNPLGGLGYWTSTSLPIGDNPTVAWAIQFGGPGHRFNTPKSNLPGFGVEGIWPVRGGK